MNQSEWIVDRLPTEEESDAHGDVFIPELAQQLRDDYDLPNTVTDEEVLEEYGYYGKYADTWDHLGDAREQFEALADAFLELEARNGEVSDESR